MHSFEDQVYRRFAEEIRRWNAPDIYAISFFIYDFDDDSRRPQVHLSYNTIAHWQSKIPRASSPEEAKWNFAFWPQEFEPIIPYIPFDKPGEASQGEEEALRDEWLRSLGLYFREENHPEDDREFKQAIERWMQVTEAFVALCVRIARRLHEFGDITATFGRPIPIIVHELEYYDTILLQTLEANPPGVAQEFEAWYCSEIVPVGYGGADPTDEDGKQPNTPSNVIDLGPSSG